MLEGHLMESQPGKATHEEGDHQQPLPAEGLHPQPMLMPGATFLLCQQQQPHAQAEAYQALLPHQITVQKQSSCDNEHFSIQLSSSGPTKHGAAASG